MSPFTKLLRRLRLRHADPVRDDLAAGGPWADVEFVVPNMVCEGCAEKIDGALHPISGVREVRSNVSQKRIRVRYEPTKVRAEQLKDAVNQAGFQAVDA